jgi:autonomous glycyl radical cofactor GrcA
MRRRGFWLSVGAVAVLLGCMQGTAMAKMVLWSEMKGRVVLNGQPAPGAVLIRNYEWHWKDEKGSDRTVANANGEFTFPSIVGRSLLGGFLPHEPVVEQAMTVEYKGVTYKAWNHFRRTYSDNEESPNGQPINVTCRLDAERKAHGEVAGICDFN